MKPFPGDRHNLVLREREQWQPPAFIALDSPRARLTAAVRRFFDFPAGSIWRDLVPALGALQGVVVDAGCGAQPYRGLLSPSVQYIGIDTAEALEHFGYDQADVRTIAADGTWPLEDDSVDAVLATETLEHVPVPEAFLIEAARVLRPGGSLIMTVPFSARWHYIPHDYWRFTPTSLKMLLTGAGFSEVAVYGRGNAVTVACYKLFALLMAAILPQDGPGKMRIRPLGLPLVPLAVAVALVANRSLDKPAGDDCIGYTTYAVKSTRSD